MKRILLIILFASSILLAQDAHFKFYPATERDSSRNIDTGRQLFNSSHSNSMSTSRETWEANWTGPKTSISVDPEFIGMDENGNTITIYEYKNEINVQNIKIIKYAPDFSEEWIFDFNNAFGSDDWFKAAFVSPEGDITLFINSQRQEGVYKYARMVISSQGEIISEDEYDIPGLSNFSWVFNQNGDLWFTGARRVPNKWYYNLLAYRINTDGDQTTLIDGEKSYLDDIFPYLGLSNENEVVLFLYNMDFSAPTFSITKMDSLGNILWDISRPSVRISSYYFTPIFNGYEVDSLGNSYAFYLNSTDSKFNLIKVSSIGTTLWENQTEIDYPQSLSIDPQQNVYISSGTYSADRLYHLYKYSRYGIPLWSKQYENKEFDYNSTLSKIKFDRENNSYIQTDDYIFSCDSSGNIRWEYSESNGTFINAELYLKSSGLLSVAAAKKVMFFSPTGQVLADKIIDFPEYSKQTFIDMIQTTNGDFIIALSINWDLGLMRVDSLGKVLWSKEYDELGHNHNIYLFNVGDDQFGLKHKLAGWDDDGLIFTTTQFRYFDANGQELDSKTHYDDRFIKYLFANWQSDGYIHTLFNIREYQNGDDRDGIYYERYDKSGNLKYSKILKWVDENVWSAWPQQAYIDNYGKIHFLYREEFIDANEDYKDRYIIHALDPYGSFEEIPIELDFSRDGLNGRPFFFSDNGDGIYTIFCDTNYPGFQNNICAYTSDDWDYTKPKFIYTPPASEQYAVPVVFNHQNNGYLMTITYRDSVQIMRITKDFKLKWEKTIYGQYYYHNYSNLTTSLDLNHIGLVFQNELYSLSLKILDFASGNFIKSLDYYDPQTRVNAKETVYVPGFGQFYLPIDKGNYQFGFVRFDATVPGNPVADKTAPIQLNGNYPNPFNGSSVIEFDLPESGDVEFSVYNILGQRVHQQKEFMSAGRQYLEFRQERLSSGTYIYRISQKGKSVTGKLLLIK